MMFDPETLRTLIGVAKTGSFSRAAGRLCKTIATISYHTKLLEENTGVAPFFRTTRSMTLTAAGSHLLSQVKGWFAWPDSMPSELQQANDRVERQVDIAASNLLYSPEAVARLLSWFNARYPFTQFHFSRQIHMGVRDSLLYEGFSLATGVTGIEPMANTFTLDPLDSAQWRLVMSADHSLANISGSLTEAQLCRFPAINAKDSARILIKWVAWRLLGQKKIIVPDMEAKLAAYLAGVGIGFAPQPLCQPLLDSGQLINSIILTVRPPSSLSLAWHKFGAGKAVDNVVTLFTQRKSEIAGSLAIFSNARD